ALLILALAFIAAPLAAQQGTLGERIEVRVVNVDVVVTDRDGNRVTGLTRHDFEILEAQKPQAITNFYEFHDGDASQRPGPDGDLPAPPPRRVVFFIDAQSLHPYNRGRIAAAVRNFIETQLNAGDLASVVLWNGALEVVAPLTSDRNVLDQAVDTVESSGGGGSAIRAGLARVQSHCVRSLEMARSGGMFIHLAYADCINVASGQTVVAATQSRQLLSAIEMTITTIAGAEGKKFLVLAGAMMPKTPGAEIYRWANQLFRPFMQGFDAPMARPHQDDEQNEVLQRVAQTANANGVTLYTIAATITTDPSGAEQQHAVDDAGADFFDQGNTFDSYELLASMTGGVAVRKPVDFDAALATIARDFQSYYSLGYRPREPSSRERVLTVRTKNRSHVVRARQTHVDKTAEQVMSDRVVANVLAPAPATSWRTTVHTGAAEAAGPNFAVPIEIVMEPELTLLPSGPLLAGGFTVYVAVGTPQGALSTVFRQPESVRIQPAEEKAFRKEPLTFGATLTVRPGENIVSVGMVDHVSGATSFARATVVAR
ncbi:MAG TPA: VWA domain-containing protein, partial [Thermoanaerobaculia bacterium]|nr:VWA domain-containing protein [Thermoanaerobaculia bacterium]